MKMKKISSMILTLSLCLAPLNSLAISNDSIPVEPETKVEDVNSEEEINSEENQSERSIIGGIIIEEIVRLSVKASHANAHRSYTKIVTRQGKKYEVTYEAIPRSECYLCEYNSY